MIKLVKIFFAFFQKLFSNERDKINLNYFQIATFIACIALVGADKNAKISAYENVINFTPN